MRVIVTGARTPFALHLSRLFHSAGHEVILTDSQKFALARFTRMKARFVRTANARFARDRYRADILALIEEEKPDLVVPSCEEIFYLSDILGAAGLSDLLYAAPLKDLAEVHDKARFAGLANRLGVGAARNIVLTSKADVDAFDHDPRGFVFKPVFSRFASHVLIGPERAGLEALTPTPDAPWLAQTRIEGEEMCAYAVARHGRIVAHAVYRNLMRVGAGTSICYEPVTDPEIEEFLTRFAATTGWHGQVSFDVIRARDGRLTVIECNPRATSGLSLFGPGDGLVEAMLGDGAGVTPSRGRLCIKGTAYLVGLLGWFGILPRQPWVRLFFSSGDALGFPGEWSLLHGQILSVAELYAVSKNKGCTILEASTHDMEWNGEGLGADIVAGPPPAGEALV